MADIFSRLREKTKVQPKWLSVVDIRRSLAVLSRRINNPSGDNRHAVQRAHHITPSACPSRGLEIPLERTPLLEITTAQLFDSVKPSSLINRKHFENPPKIVLGPLSDTLRQTEVKNNRVGEGGAVYSLAGLGHRETNGNEDPGTLTGGS